MQTLQRYLTGGVMTVAAAVIGVTAAPPAVAECTSSGGATVCAQGDVRGGDGGGPVSGPYYPYPCEDDWLCGDDFELGVVVDPPNRPGGRPPSVGGGPIIPGGGGGIGGRR